MKIIFFGSDDFSIAHLKALWEERYCVVACVAPPDRPKGRGMAIQASPVKDFALDHDCPVLQPISFRSKETLDALQKFDADVFVVIAYGRILPLEVLAIPRLAAVNVHGSLLPKYRGAAPINWAIINGETQTGLSVIRMNAGMDAGAILNDAPVDILPEETVPMLRAKMMMIGPAVLMEALKKLEQHQSRAIPQDETLVTYAPKLTKVLGLIDWKLPAVKIHALVRGLLPWPTAYTSFNGKMLKILQAEVLDASADVLPGTLIDLNRDGLVVATGQGVLSLKEVHLSASRRMPAYDFACGHQLKAGYCFL